MEDVEKAKLFLSSADNTRKLSKGFEAMRGRNQYIRNRALKLGKDLEYVDGLIEQLQKHLRLIKECSCESDIEGEMSRWEVINSKQLIDLQARLVIASAAKMLE